MKTRAILSVTLAALFTLALPRDSLANGRFPSAGHVEVDPANPAHVAVRATYGLLVSRDGGEKFGWVCEEALGFSGVWDPPIGIAADGTILAGLPDGLAVSQENGCAWSRVDALETKLVVDLSVDKKNPKRAVVLASSPSGNGFDNRLFVTNDGGKSFSPLPASLPEELRALTVDLAPSDPGRMYVSGVMQGAMPMGAVLRSEDSGGSFVLLSVPESDADHGPYIGAVDPVDAARLYVRLEGAPGRLFSSADGGETWEEIFTGEGPLLGFALSPDGSRLVVGGEKDGLWRSPAPAWAFEQVSFVRARCLRWAEAGIYACGEEALDGFAVGLSTTDGSTFAPLNRTSELCGELECGSGTIVRSECRGRWPAVRDLLGAKPCEAPPIPPTPEEPPPKEPEGCGCRAAGSGEGALGWVFIMVMVAAWKRKASA